MVWGCPWEPQKPHRKDNPAQRLSHHCCLLASGHWVPPFLWGGAHLLGLEISFPHETG